MMLRVEFHCHTAYSADSVAKPEAILEACRRKGVDRVVITDHNTIAGARYAQRLDPERVIVGEEIYTQHGELLAAYVSEEVPKGLSPLESIRRLRDQGAFISVSHPFDQLRGGHWQLDHLMAILPLVDALEVYNARCLWPGFNWQAQALAAEHGLLGTSGSDAHAPFEIGKATLDLPEFHDAESLRLALGSARPKWGLSAPWVHFASRYAHWLKKNGKVKAPEAE